MSEVLYETRGRVAVMTLNRPEKMNALTPEGLRLQAELLKEYKENDDVWALMITGAGKAFSTGLDLSKAKDMMGAQQEHATLFGPHPVQIWKPMVAAVNGYAVGGGCEIAMACDIRIASEHARMGLPEVKRALIPGAGGIQRLIRQVSFGDAMKMLLTGDWIDAEEALRIGLVQEVVAANRVEERSFELCERICENGPVAVRSIKEAAYRGADMSFGAALVQDQLYSFRNRQTEDAKEGPRAFMEKRAPRYTGRAAP